MRSITTSVFRLFVVLVAASLEADAQTIELKPTDDWFSVLNGSQLQPGQTVVLSEGVYSDPRRLTLRHVGHSDAPIVIQAQDGHTVTFKRPDMRQNTFNIEGAQYLVLKDIEITGGSTAIRISKFRDRMARNVTLLGLHIHHIGGVAVTCNHVDNVYSEMLFQGNHIHHTGGHGEAFYLGANNDRAGKTQAVFRDSVIEGNYIHDLKGPNVSQGDGVEIKDGSFNNIIRDNIIHDTNYPGIIVYGTDGQGTNVIERNAIWNSGDHGIQAAADAVIRNNVIFDVRSDGIRSQKHQSASVGNLRIVNNTIVKKAGTGIRIDSSPMPSETVIVANNAVFAPEALRAAQSPKLLVAGNVFASSPDGNLQNYFPVAGSAMIGAADPAYLPEDDFDGTSRRGSLDVGAYRYRNHYDGPGITAGFKEIQLPR